MDANGLPSAWLHAPRKFPLRDRFTYLRVERPDWLPQDPALRQFFDHHAHLLAYGRLVLAATIQVNRVLFEPGGPDAPGEVVYDLMGGMTAEELSALAGRLARLRENPGSEPRAARIGAYLADQYERVFGWPVPDGWGPETCRISTTYFPRHHLRGGVLDGQILAVCAEGESGMAAVFPARYLA